MIRDSCIVIRVSCIVMLLMLNLSAINAFGETISSRELIENAKSLDGKRVVYQGEVVTAVLNRGEYSWVNLKDNANVIGVWCQTPQVECIKFIGGYKIKGDILEVEGIFNRACPLHGGDLDIHADRVKVLERGFPMEENISLPRISISIALFLMILLAIAVFRKRL